MHLAYEEKYMKKINILLSSAGLVILYSLHPISSHAANDSYADKLNWKALKFNVRGYPGEGPWCVQSYMSGESRTFKLQDCKTGLTEIAYTSFGQIMARLKDNQGNTHFWCLSGKDPVSSSYEYLTMDYCDLNDPKQSWKFEYVEKEKAYRLFNQKTKKQIESRRTWTPYLASTKGGYELLLPIKDYGEWVMHPSSPRLEFSTDLTFETPRGKSNLQPLASGWVYATAYDHTLRYNAHNRTLSMAYYNGARQGRTVCLKATQSGTRHWVTNEYCSTDSKANPELQWTLRSVPSKDDEISISDIYGRELRVQTQAMSSTIKLTSDLYTYSGEPANDSWGHINTFRVNKATAAAALWSDRVVLPQRSRVPREVIPNIDIDYLTFSLMAGFLYLQAQQLAAPQAAALASPLPGIQDIVGRFHAGRLVPTAGENRYLDDLYELVRNQSTYAFQFLTSRFFGGNRGARLYVENPACPKPFNQVYDRSPDALEAVFEVNIEHGRLTGNMSFMNFAAIFDAFMGQQANRDTDVMTQVDRFLHQLRYYYTQDSGNARRRNIALLHFIPRPDPHNPHVEPSPVFIVTLSGGTMPGAAANQEGDPTLYLRMDPTGCDIAATPEEVKPKKANKSKLPKPEPQWLDTLPNGLTFNRIAYAERAGLEYMLQDERIRPLLERGGVLRIMTERPVCNGCQIAIAEFMHVMPNVIVGVVHGSSREPSPTLTTTIEHSHNEP